MRLGPCYVELHYVTVLDTLPLFYRPLRGCAGNWAEWRPQKTVSQKGMMILILGFKIQGNECRRSHS